MATNKLTTHELATAVNALTREAARMKRVIIRSREAGDMVRVERNEDRYEEVVAARGKLREQLNERRGKLMRGEK